MPDLSMELDKLVQQVNIKNEVECGAYLQYALPLLLQRTPISIITMSREDRSYFGSSDFAVSATFQGDTGRIETDAYIWEIKAPQCNLMVLDDNQNRYRPSQDLYKAENQLIHYVYEANHNGDFKDRFKIGATGRVRAGGIIIGTDDRIVPDGDRFDANKAHHSLHIRKITLYRHEDIKVLTWTRVVEFLKPASRMGS